MAHKVPEENVVTKRLSDFRFRFRPPVAVGSRRHRKP
jgi:hypothetical protein